MAHTLTLQLRKRMPHRAFNSAIKQRGNMDIPVTAIDIKLENRSETTV